MFTKVKSLTGFSILSMALSSASFAGVYATVNDYVKVGIPPLNPGFEVSVAALWLRPGASNLNYAILNKELPAESPTWVEQELRPSFTPAFNLDVGYVFPNCAGQDVKLNWTHLRTNDSQSVNADNVSYFIGPDYEIGPAGIPIHHANGNVQFNYDVVNLDFGQSLAFGDHVALRFFGGLSYGYLQEEVKATYTGVRIDPFPGPFSMLQDMTSTFNGIGPRFGIHADYFTDCWTGFGFMGDFAVSTLIGSLNSRTNYTGSAAELLDTFGLTTNHQFIKDQTVYQVVPGLDAKLGVNYKRAFNNIGMFTLTAGYQAAVYVNAISQYLPGTLVDGAPLEAGGIFVATMNHTLSNYSVQGPFLEAVFQF